MTHDHLDPDLVRISLPGPNAVSEPIFLIKVGDIYYATLSVWEYNPAHAVGKEKEGYDVVDKYFREHESHVVGHAIRLKVGDPPSMTSTTNPPQPKQRPTRPKDPTRDEPPREPSPDPVRGPPDEPTPKESASASET